MASGFSHFDLYDMGQEKYQTNLEEMEVYGGFVGDCSFLSFQALTKQVFCATPLSFILQNWRILCSSRRASKMQVECRPPSVGTLKLNLMVILQVI